MKKLVAFILCMALVITCVACFAACNDTAKTYEIAVVTDVGQLMDGGFNQGTYEGAKAYAEAHGLTYQYYQPANGADATDNDRIAAMRQAIKNGAKVIVAPGFLQATAMTTVATESPEVKFIFVDGWALSDANGQPLQNVTAVVYKEEESGYMAGYAAEELNKEVELKLSYKFGAGFGASVELQTQISGWYTAGTEVVFACGGSMFQSVKSAAEATTNGKIIGVDVDQAPLSDRVITSAVKGLSVSVQKILGEFYGGEWDTKLAAKASNLGAADDATGLPTATWRMSKFTVENYNTLFAAVKAGSVSIKNDIAENCDNQEFWTGKITSTKVTITLDK